MNYYGFVKEETVAFGDGENDIEMFDVVGTAIAMKNGKEEVKKKADIICDDVNEKGIVLGLEKLGLIKK